MDERVVLWSWCPECGERHSSDRDCVASRRLSAALDAFIAAYGDGCTWREVPGLVAGSRIAALESERDEWRRLAVDSIDRAELALAGDAETADDLRARAIGLSTPQETGGTDDGA